MTTANKTIEAFRKHLVAAAAKAGVSDLGDLTIDQVSMERTWGDLEGLFFTGTHAARAAACFQKWATRKNLEGAAGSYSAQHSLGDVKPFHRTVCTNGAISHGAGHTLEIPSYYQSEAAEYAARFTVIPGFAVSFVYYPCND